MNSLLDYLETLTDSRHTKEKRYLKQQPLLLYFWGGCVSIFILKKELRTDLNKPSIL